MHLHLNGLLCTQESVLLANQRLIRLQLDIQDASRCFRGKDNRTCVRFTGVIDPGHIAMFEPTVQYDIKMVKGIKNVLFAGEGLFLATLTGPGKIWLETMPLSNLAAKVSKYIPKKG